MGNIPIFPFETVRARAHLSTISRALLSPRRADIQSISRCQLNKLKELCLSRAIPGGSISSFLYSRTAAAVDLFPYFACFFPLALYTSHEKGSRRILLASPTNSKLSCAFFSFHYSKGRQKEKTGGGNSHRGPGDPLTVVERALSGIRRCGHRAGLFYAAATAAAVDPVRFAFFFG